jgi:hypothetical protein
LANVFGALDVDTGVDESTNRALGPARGKASTAFGPSEFAKKEETKSLSAAKSQNFFASTILVCTVMLCCSAEGAPKYSGNRPMVSNASPDITTQIGRTDTDTVTCYVFNKSLENICVVYDVYPVWNFSHPTRGTVSEFIPRKTGRNIAWRLPRNRHQCSANLSPQGPYLGTLCVRSVIVRPDVSFLR